MKRILSPSIMCADFGALREEINLLDEAGADIFHMDIMDGVFVPNFALSWHDFAIVRSLTDKPLDVHLMVNDPSIHLPYAYKSGADIIYIHYESRDSEWCLEDIKAHGRKAGLVINPGTRIEDCEHLFPKIDKLLVMRVNPGFAGQTAVPEVESKIYQLAQLRNRQFQIALDGNVTPEVVEKWSKAGVDEFILGTASLFGKERSYKEILKELQGMKYC